MPSDRFVIRLPLLKLLIGLVLTLVPICAVGLYAISHTEKAMDRTVGNHFRTIAQSTASEVSQFINDRVLSVGTMAANPVVTEAAAESNRSYENSNEQAIAARLQKMESGWDKPAGEGYVRQMLTSRASRLLNRYREIDRRFLRITLTDAHGGTIAATHKTLDYYQADEDFWQKIYANGRGAVNITDVLYDEVTKSYYLGLGVPVMEEGSNRVIGVLDALVEVSSLFPLIHRIETGPTMRAALVKADGTVIYSPTTNLAMNAKSNEFAATEEVRQTTEGLQRGYAVVSLRDGVPTLVAFANTGLEVSFPNLNWKVLVIQDADQAFAATRGVLRLILFEVALALAALTFLTVYFSLHRRREYTDLAAKAPGPQASKV